MSREVELKERLEILKKNLAEEKALDTPSQFYLSDLQDSIAGCKRELGFIKKHPSGVQMVNGMTPDV